jgi:thymidylate synthase (FAD)
MLDIVKKWVPHCFEAFIRNRKNAKEFSEPALNVIKQMIKGENINQENSNLSIREWNELIETLEIK